MRTFLGLVFLVVIIAMMSGGRESPAPPARPQQQSNPFWPEGTNMSAECTEQAVQERLTPACKANLDRWGAQLQKNLEDPEFVEHLINRRY